jgi:TM2 domain-containing membrane protein YozV
MTNVPPDDNWPNQVPAAPIPAAPTASAPTAPPPTAAGPVAGWYPDGSGATRWWDGTQWGQVAPAAAPAPPVPTVPAAAASLYQGSAAAPAAGPPPPPWGTWSWGNGAPIDRNTLPHYDSSKKVTAGILAILLGGLGVHKFYLGYTAEGIIMILLLFCGISPIIGLVEGIIYLTKSDPDFYWTYEAARKPWF